MSDQAVAELPPRTLVRHEGCTPRERSTCGWRDRLISREDVDLNPAAWAHAVDIDGASRKPDVLSKARRRHQPPQHRRRRQRRRQGHQDQHREQGRRDHFEIEADV